MRFIHTSDWHLGRSLHGAPLLEEQGIFLDWLLHTAQARAADAVVVAGDVYDRAVPQLDAVRLLDRTLARFSRASIPLLITSGNHDSAVRLGFGSALNESAGVHLRTSISELARPVVLEDDGGPVAFYGIPYLLPDAAMAALEVTDRSHVAVLSAAMSLIRGDAAERGIDRVVVAAHAFVTGAKVSESERDIRVGGIGDTPVSVFDGVSYVALGHLHGAQRVSPPEAATTSRYCGSPLAFSFSERHHHKSVALVEVDGTGRAAVELLPAPVPRALREVRGHLDDLLARAGTDLSDVGDSWVKAVLTDASRPVRAMERLRSVWPHTLVLEFSPDVALTPAATDLAHLAATSDPVEICSLFVEWVDASPATERQRAILRRAAEAAGQHVVEREEVA